MIQLQRKSRNLHYLDFTSEKIAVLSDLHWDNPKCQREKLKKHLDYCLEHEIPVIVNGDFFCLMQGRGDRRGNKSDIRPEHNNAKYIDSVIETAVEWFSPYAQIMTVLGYGNHESGIIKYQETDVLQRFVDLLNYKNQSNVQTGGYGGWIVLRLNKDKNMKMSKTLKYFHGSGGGGIVTKGGINLTRALEMYENMDIFALGHIHENWARNDLRDTIHYNKGKHEYEMVHKDIHMMITGTYKEEYDDGAVGWHIERAAPPKVTGGRILTFQHIRDQSGSDKSQGIHKNNNTLLIDSMKFPL